jgi:hypothetical protein
VGSTLREVIKKIVDSINNDTLEEMKIILVFASI